VVDTEGFNARPGSTWPGMQLPISSTWWSVTLARLGHLKWEITIEDPVMYTRPWKVTEITPLLNSGDLIEYVCTENERDSRHLDAIDALQKSDAIQKSKSK